ncbi:MAG: hypothetical protein HYV07_23690 [Deltaproteobacteria bacterium]|nr:hypothetical protein [Deltaproteobacteria bacterium]
MTIEALGEGVLFGGHFGELAYWSEGYGECATKAVDAIGAHVGHVVADARGGVLAASARAASREAPSYLLEAEELDECSLHRP